MERHRIGTKRGEATYYTRDDFYLDMLTFLVKYKDELSETEFSIPNQDLTIGEKNQAVIVFSAGYEQGRQRGSWEKAKRMRELFDTFKRELLG